LGHLGGTFSVVEILTSLYYLDFIRDTRDECPVGLRDRLILSKGHACLALYPILLDLGLIDQDLYDSYGSDGGLGGQLDISLPGVGWNTGSLGHAVGVGAGIAMGAKIFNFDTRVFAVLGDAELAEGSFWEAVAFASDFSLKNLTVIVDRNRLSVTSELGDDAIFREIRTKLKAFGWHYIDLDGHDFSAIELGLQQALDSSLPTLIMANTIKGKGVGFMQNSADWHHGAPSQDDFESAMSWLDAAQ